MLADVDRFYEQVLGHEKPHEPRLLSNERLRFKLGHLEEEAEEFSEATIEGDLEGAVDGLIDIAYVALGALIEMGVAPGPVWDEVHEANMLRERGKTKRGSEELDAVKPDGWTKPGIELMLNLTRRHLLKTAKPKILVIGHARHGKDTICERLRDFYGLSFTSSSMFCAEHVMLPWFEQSDLVYTTAEECFEDRGNHRAEWFQAIREYNRADGAALARAILAHHDVYCGMRSAEEVFACKDAGLFDRVIWVDAGDRVPPEDSSSCTVHRGMADHVVDTSGSIAEGHRELDQVMMRILP